MYLRTLRFVKGTDEKVESVEDEALAPLDVGSSYFIIQAKVKFKLVISWNLLSEMTFNFSNPPNSNPGVRSFNSIE